MHARAVNYSVEWSASAGNFLEPGRDGLDVAQVERLDAMRFAMQSGLRGLQICAVPRGKDDARP